MKVIDVLNKIANDEEVPKKIKYCYQVYKVADVGEDYYNYENNCWFFKDKFDVSIINDEIDLIEDDDKDIPLIPDDELYNFNNPRFYFEGQLKQEEKLDYNFKVLQEKINQIIKKINEEGK